MLADLVMATPQELLTACHGWVVPLDVPRKVSWTNPFTKLAQEGASWVPPDVEFAGAESHPQFGGLTPLDVKGLGYTALATLIAVLMDWTYERAIAEIARPPLAGPPDSDLVLVMVPAPALDGLANLTEPRLRAVGQAWAEQVRADISSIRNPGVREMELQRWTESVFHAYLADIVAFAASARSRQKQLYYWTSP